MEFQHGTKGVLDTRTCQEALVPSVHAFARVVYKNAQQRVEGEVVHRLEGRRADNIECIALPQTAQACPH